MTETWINFAETFGHQNVFLSAWIQVRVFAVLCYIHQVAEATSFGHTLYTCIYCSGSSQQRNIWPIITFGSRIDMIWLNGEYWTRQFLESHVRTAIPIIEGKHSNISASRVKRENKEISLNAMVSYQSGPVCSTLDVHYVQLLWLPAQWMSCLRDLVLDQPYSWS